MEIAPAQSSSASLLSIRARLRPMGVGDILDESFRLYRANFLLFIATAAVLLAPLLLLAAVAWVGALTLEVSTMDTTGVGAPSGPLVLLWIVLGLAGFVVGLLGVAALTVAASQRYLDQPITLRAAYVAALKRLRPLLLASLWAGVRLLPIAAISAFVIGVPFLIYYALAWILIPQAVVLEGTGAGGASKRSRRLIEGYWWKTLGLYLVLTILLNILAAIPTLVLTSVVGGVATVSTGSSAALIVVYAIVSVVTPVLLLPLVFIATTLLFYDLKIRKEAFDLQTMAETTLPSFPWS